MMYSSLDCTMSSIVLSPLDSLPSRCRTAVSDGVVVLADLCHWVRGTYLVIGQRAERVGRLA